MGQGKTAHTGNFSIPALIEWVKDYSGINHAPLSSGALSRTHGIASFIPNF